MIIMNKKSSDTAIIAAVIVIIIMRAIGWNNVPKPIMVIFFIIIVPVMVIGGLLKDNYFKTHNIYASLFFILIVVCGELVGIDIAFESNKFYSQRISKYVSGVAFALFCLSLVSVIIGAIKQEKKN